MRKGKPKIQVNTYVDSYESEAVSVGDSKYEKERKVSLKKEIAHIKKNLKNWDNDEAGKAVRGSLEEDLRNKEESLKNMDKKKSTIDAKRHQISFS